MRGIPRKPRHIVIEFFGKRFVRPFWHGMFGTIRIRWQRIGWNGLRRWWWESMTSLPSLPWIRGSGFLHHMVRNLVGTLILVGKGTLQVDDVTRILGARNRSAAGATAPACGLYLVNVEY